MLGKDNVLKNREMHIDYNNDTVNVKNDTVNYNNDTVKAKNGIVKTENGIVKAENGIVKDKISTILALLKQNKDITVKEISDTTKISIRTINRNIKALKEQGKVERVGSDKTGYWEVKE